MSVKTSILVALMALALLACNSSEAPSHEASSPAVSEPGADPAAPAPIEAAVDDVAPGVCGGVDMQLTDARSNEYARHVADAVEDGKVKPDEVNISGFMQSGAWSAAYASIPIADPGYFVFETADGQVQFKDVWAGIADEGDRAGLVDWAEALGAPDEFASCFAQTVID